MLSLKLLLISTAVIFTALGLKSSLPSATTNLNILRNFFILCFTPPYLFVTVNAIIISILASSKFHHSHTQPSHPIVDPTPPPALVVNTVLVDASRSPPSKEEEEEEIKQIDLGIFPLKKMDSPENLPPIDKPLLSTRFTRKPLKSGLEGGKALKVAAKQKRHDTLENTWKAITEGRSIPLSRHMKKCDTWQNRYDDGPHQLEDSTTVNVSDFNFNNKTWKLRKEPSLSQDELNKRVEAFIRKFNNQMRLQRQDSLNHYMHMINHGAS